MGSSLEAGGGAGAGAVAAVGPLQRMWRSVYKKAAEVAEARTQELLKYHVYVYPHGAGDGGGGGGAGWTLVYEHEVTASGGELALRLPDTGSLPQTHGSLVLEVRARSTSTGTGREQLTLQANAEAAYLYHYTLTRNDNGTVDGFASPNDSAWDIGGCPRAGAAAGNVGTSTVQLPMYARTDAKKPYLARGITGYGSGTSNMFAQDASGWVNTTDAISALVLRTATGQFAAGTLVRLWGVTGAGGAAGGGAGWVLIEDRTLAAGGSAVFTGLPQTYRDLRFVLDGRATGTGVASGGVRLQLNNDTAATAYRSTVHYAQVGTGNHGVAAAAGGTQNRDFYALVGDVPGELATDAGATGVVDLVLYHYTLTDRYKRFLALNTLTGDQTAGAQTRHASGEWRGTAAVDRVALFPPSGDGWAAGTRVRCYGWSDGA